jgi:EpsI family protein
VGNGKEKQLTILAVLLLLTGVLAYWSTDSVKVVKPADLQATFGPVPGYKAVEFSPLDAQTFSFLDLDDYTQTRYGKDGKSVSLYIGYYFSLDKVSAAHSPLVCFPGQGWKVSHPEKRRLSVNQNEIHYTEIVASREGRQELVLFWYQAHEKTAPEVYQNKLNALLNKITSKKQEHAFVRITVPIGESGPEEAEKAAKDFIAAFYPAFLTYINSTL